MERAANTGTAQGAGAHADKTEMNLNFQFTAKLHRVLIGNRLDEFGNFAEEHLDLIVYEFKPDCNSWQPGFVCTDLATAERLMNAAKDLQSQNRQTELQNMAAEEARKMTGT